MSVTIIHNPRCSKSRQTLALLQQQGIEPEIVEYLKQPLSKEQLTDIVNKLDLPIESIIRSKEKEYKGSGLDNAELTNEQKIAILVATPKLIERPIVINNDKAAIGRPPEQVLDIL